jgi:hypothetical protein
MVESLKEVSFMDWFFVIVIAVVGIMLLTAVIGTIVRIIIYLRVYDELIEVEEQENIEKKKSKNKTEKG